MKLLVVTMINLFPIICGEYQKLIIELNNFFNFDQNIFILDSTADINSFIITRPDKFTPQSLYVFDSIDENFTELDRLTRVSSKNTFTIVVSVYSDYESCVILLKRIKKIQRLQTNMKIGMFFPHFISTEKLHKLFGWCKEHLIVNIFAATYPDTTLEPTSEFALNIFTFDPFGTFDGVINVTGSETLISFFPSLNFNFHGHVLRLGCTFGWVAITELWLLVFKMMNASYMLVQHNFSILRDEHLEFGIDIIPRYFRQSEVSQLYIYPLKTESQVIIVPEAVPYSEFSAYLQTVTTDKFFGFSLLTIAVVILLLNIFRYIKQRKISFFKTAADVLNLLMNDNGRIRYSQLSPVEVLLIVPLTFLGFVIVNGILSNLHSYLTRPVLQPQINTPEDIYRSTLPIITWSNRWKQQLIGVLSNLTKYDDWADRIIILEEHLFDRHLANLNRSASLLIDLSTANLLLNYQKRIDIKGYHNPNIRISNFFVSFKLSDRFLFFERLNDIIHRIQSAGLYQLWTRTDDVDLAKFIKLKAEKLDVDRFPIPMFIIYGWIASVIVLVLEIFWKHFKLSQITILAEKIGQFLRNFSCKTKIDI